MCFIASIFLCMPQECLVTFALCSSHVNQVCKFDCLAGESASVKTEFVRALLDTLVASGHRVLVFSQVGCTEINLAQTLAVVAGTCEWAV